MKQSIFQNVAQGLAILASLNADPSSAFGRPGCWTGLQHRGQAPARGILGKRIDPLTLGKMPGRRDRHRAHAARMHVGTYPDFSAERAQEAKAARSRRARMARR